MNMSFLQRSAGMWLLPGLAGDPRRAGRASGSSGSATPTMRKQMLAASQSQEAGVFRRLADWGDYVIGDTYSDGQRGPEEPQGRATSPPSAASSVRHAARHRASPTSCARCCGRSPQDGDDESWRMRAELWNDARAMIGGSDAGAHLDRMCGAPYPTRWLADCIRGRKLFPVEHAVQMMTSEPAALFGLRDRGVLREGAVRRRRRVRPGDGRLPRRPRSSPTCPATRRASPPARSASSGSSSTARSSSSTARPPARPRARCCAAAPTPTPFSTAPALRSVPAGPSGSRRRGDTPRARWRP